MEFVVRIARNRGRPSSDQSPSFTSACCPSLLSFTARAALGRPPWISSVWYRQYLTASLCEFPPTTLAVFSHALVCRPRSLTTPSPPGLLRATSHTRLRALVHCTSSTLIGGKGGAGPSSLHTTLEGPTGYVNPRWM